MRGASMKARSFPGDLDSLSLIRQFIADVAVEAGLDSCACQRLCLAVDEIVTNAIVYGYIEAGVKGTVDIIAQLEPTALVIEVEDTAAPYDPTARPMPTEEDLTRPLEERVPGGLGIFLATQSVDGLRYQRAGEKNRTILTMSRTRTL